MASSTLKPHSMGDRRCSCSGVAGPRAGFGSAGDRLIEVRRGSPNRRPSTTRAGSAAQDLHGRATNGRWPSRPAGASGCRRASSPPSSVGAWQRQVGGAHDGRRAARGDARDRPVPRPPDARGAAPRHRAGAGCRDADDRAGGRAGQPPARAGGRARARRRGRGGHRRLRLRQEPLRRPGRPARAARELPGRPDEPRPGRGAAQQGDRDLRGADALAALSRQRGARPAPAAHARRRHAPPSSARSSPRRRAASAARWPRRSARWPTAAVNRPSTTSSTGSAASSARPPR